MSNIIHANEASFEKVIAQGVTLIDFFATWCGPCKMLHPELEKLSDAYVGKAKVVKIDVDENQALAMRFAIQSVPTLLIFKDGVLVSRVQGYHPYPQLATMIDQQL